MVNRRSFLKMCGLTAASASVSPGSVAQNLASADYSIDIAPYTLELSPKHHIKTSAYNQQVPGPLLRFTEGKPVTIDVANNTSSPEVVHWHGLYLPPDVDGAMEEGTPMIPAGGKARYTFTPRPAGFRWFHTHTMAGGDLKKGQYTGQHGFLMIEGRNDPGHYDQEVFLALHDWDGEMAANGDGSMNPAYQFSAINGRLLGFADPIRVKPGQRVLFHILNSSATEQHWIALAGHQFRVVALDGNPVPTPQTVPMLRLAPAERICAIVEMNTPGVWVLGEVRKHVQAAGMGIVLEYSNRASTSRAGKPQWQQPQALLWSYRQFAATAPAPASSTEVHEIPLVFESKFAGHGAPDHWRINGKSWPDTEAPPLTTGQRYRLKCINKSTDDHPIHLHRHSFELRSIPEAEDLHGIMKDVLLVPANTQLDVEFTANNPGPTLFHCHQQNHMDEGFMLLFHYA